MIRGEYDAAAAGGPEELLDAYRATLVDVVESAGAETVADRTGLSTETVESVGAGDVGDLALQDAAAILAADEGRPDADAVAAEARDVLLLGMTAAVVDVDTLASELNGPLEAKELQQKVEGRAPMTLGEYASIHYHLREHTE